MLTNYAVDLDEELVHWLVRLRSYPVHGGLICANASEHDLGRIGHIDAEDVDEFGDGLP